MGVADFTVDFSPLGELGTIYRQAQQRRALEDALNSLPAGATLADLGKVPIGTLLKAGDQGMSLAKLGQSAYLTSPDYITQSETAKAKVAEQFAPKTTNIKTLEGDEVTVQKGPNGYEIPRIQGMPTASDPNIPANLTGEARKAYQKARGTQLGNIDDKAVLEADKAVQAGTQAVQSLNKALELSKTAHYGPFASKIGYAGSLVGHQPSIDTEVLTNTVTNQALENLRGIFGGNPTEGERKILLDVQGAVSQAPAVREQIYKNAIDAANARIEFNKRNAEQMRGGRYLLPEAQRNAPQDQQQRQQAQGPSAADISAARADPRATLVEAQKAIASGADPVKVAARLKQLGINLPALSGGSVGGASSGAIY